MLRWRTNKKQKRVAIKTLSSRRWLRLLLPQANRGPNTSTPSWEERKASMLALLSAAMLNMITLRTRAMQDLAMPLSVPVADLKLEKPLRHFATEMPIVKDSLSTEVGGGAPSLNLE